MTYSDCFTNEQLHHALAKAVAERDEARDMVLRLRKQRAVARNFGEQMERERDEAREALREIASLQRYEHKFWDDGDGQIDESEWEKAYGMYLLHAQVSKILTRVLK